MSDLKQPDPNVEVPSVGDDLRKLIIDYGNACFDCGDYRDDDEGEPYDLVNERAKALHQAIDEQLKHYEQELQKAFDSLHIATTQVNESQEKLKQYEQQLQELAELYEWTNVQLREQLKQKDERIAELEQERDWEQARKEVADRQVSKLKERIARAEQVLRTIAKPALGGKSQQYAAQQYFEDLKVGSPDMPGE